MTQMKLTYVADCIHHHTWHTLCNRRSFSYSPRRPLSRRSHRSLTPTLTPILRLRTHHMLPWPPIWPLSRPLSRPLPRTPSRHPHGILTSFSYHSHAQLSAHCCVHYIGDSRAHSHDHALAPLSCSRQARVARTAKAKRDMLTTNTRRSHCDLKTRQRARREEPT